MQTTVHTAHAVPLARRLAASCWRPILFAALIALATMAGQIPVPGSPTPITLQTFAVMMAGLMLPWRQAAGAVALYLAAGAVGLPVFAGGANAVAFLGPDAGFLLGFLPGAAVTALLAGTSRRRDGRSVGRSADVDGTRRPLLAASLRAVLGAGRRLVAAAVGCIGVVYLVGFGVQAAMLHLPFLSVAAASAAFLAGDLVKAAAAALAVTCIRLLR